MAITEKRLKEIGNALVSAGNCDFRIEILFKEIRRQRRVIKALKLKLEKGTAGYWMNKARAEGRNI